MLRNVLLNNFKTLQRISIRSKSEPAVNITELERQETSFDVVDDEAQIREKIIEDKRNKSRLKPQHRNILQDEVPYANPTSWVHGTLRYNRTMYGRYGSKSGFNTSLCWPTKEELAEKREYERMAHPFTIQQMVEEAKQKKLEKEIRIQTRQEDIIKKMEKLEQWKLDLKRKIEKKESEALAAKQKKDRLIDEVRRHFGYSIDPRDEKFKELLAQKEKEQQKATKQARKKAKEEKMLATILGKAKAAEMSDDKSVESTKPSTD
ncbi:growth arrest and DNA damage-inducible proteins-interacting protein 1 [Photinus pyralis]|uniref:growth arrest and DNA damage-inducible proteins-interacting protein 1 n=1 Tax=Photinus pyralis TaxID=7054 RepID=UPI00126701EB|nr:growth arrest and DNA damage-inducible proteins-interacting protein 1 [Photinus pyralis]